VPETELQEQQFSAVIGGASPRVKIAR
jgi:hypothetical protein